MSDRHRQTISLEVDGTDPGALRAFQVEGEEAISTIYRFEVLALCRDPHLVLEDLLGRGAKLEIERNSDRRAVFGIVWEIDELDRTIEDSRAFRLVIRPRLSRLELSRQCQIYGTTQLVSVLDVVRGELSGTSKKGPGASVQPATEANDFEIRCFGQYPQRDFVVQYDETDLNFLSRLLEHDGIFYFFTEGTGKEKAVFADGNVAAPSIPGTAVIEWGPDDGLVAVDQARVRDLVRRVRHVPSRVYLRDYNYRLPHVPLLVDAEVDASGYGVVVEYGAHFKTPEDGTRLARVRAEALQCRRQTFHGRSDCPRLAAGHFFELRRHEREDMNQRYLIVSVKHAVSEAMPGTSGIGGRAETAYTNTFECIPLTVPFRPERRATTPRVDGLINGHVDGIGGGERAEIDEEGRYRIRIPFDLSGNPDGQGSKSMRLATPYGGPNNGMHFPLLKGTEVVIGCVNGDPDRPVILGSVPNPRNRSVVTSDSHDRNRIRTPSGIQFEMSDGPGSGGGGAGDGGGSGATLVPQPAGERLASATSPQLVPQGQEAALTEDLTNATWARLSVPGGATPHYLRLGAPDATSEATMASGQAPASPSAGIMINTTGNLEAKVAGGAYRRVVGEDKESIGGNRTSAITGNVTATVGGNVTETITGNVAETVTGTFAQTVDKTITITATNSASATNAVSITATKGDLKLTATSGNAVVSTSGKFRQSVGDQSGTMNWADVKVANIGDKLSRTHGNQVDFFMGSRTSLMLGPVTSVMLGLNFALSLSIDLRLIMGASVTITVGPVLQIFTNLRFTMVGTDIKYFGINVAINNTHFGMNGTTVSVDAAGKVTTSGAALNMDNVKAGMGSLSLTSKAMTLLM
jgi:type VI secretion system VgrG family protein